MRFFLPIVLLFVCCIAPVLADDVTMTFSLNGIGSSSSQSSIHDDQDVGYGFKGWATLILFNDSDSCWSDLHLSLFAVQQPFGAIFIDGGTYNPTYKLEGVAKPVTWTINNAAPGGPTMDLLFTDFVNPGETATFKVYTNNMATKTRFGMSVYPTADLVPEPSSMLAMSSALLGLAGFIIKRKR